MMKTKSRRNPLGDGDASFNGDGGTTLESLVQEALQSPGKQKKLSLLLPKEPEDFIGDQENDDESEILTQKAQQQQKKEQIANSAEKPKERSAFGVLTNLTPTELENHYTQCIQLCNKNKVNVKNAFQLQLIDYMKFIFAKQSKKTDNLVLMGVTLDASAKIYSYRVDKVYSDMMKVMSGKTFKEGASDGPEAEEGEGAEPGFDEGETPKKKRKKNFDEDKEADFEQVLCGESELLKTHVDGKGFLKEHKTLPRQYDFFLDCPLRDPVGLTSLNGPVFDLEEEENNTASIRISHKAESSSLTIELLSYLPGYNEIHKSYFVIGKEDESAVLSKSLVYDATEQESLIEPFRRFDDNDDDDLLEMDHDQVVDYDDGLSDDEPALPVSSAVHNSVNSSKSKSFSIGGMSAMVSVSDNEYSFFDSSKLNFWAGPSHWSIKPKKKKIVDLKEISVQKGAKKAVQLDFFNFVPNDMLKVYNENVVTLTKRTLRTWSRDKNRNIVFSYTQKKLLSLFHDDNLLYINKNFSEHGIFSAASNKHLDEDGQQLTPETFICREDDEMEANMLNDHHDDDDGDGPCSPLRDDGDDPGNESMGLELIPAPSKVNKIAINFSKNQKSVNIKLLKTTIWDYMNLESSMKENIPVETTPKVNGFKRVDSGPVTFSEVYSTLPKLLPPEDGAQLSCGIVFMAILHMANEKTLKLVGNGKHTDFEVFQP